MGEKKGFFSKLKAGLSKTRDNLVKGIDSLFSGYSEIDDDFYEELEEILIMADLGINVTTEIIEDLKAKVKENTYLRYEEDQNLIVTFKVDEKGIWLTRNGLQMKLRLYFDEAKHYETNYQTPFGAIKLTCQTQKVLFEEENAKGQLAVDYQLFSGEELLGEYKIRLQFEA